MEHYKERDRKNTFNGAGSLVTLNVAKIKGSNKRGQCFQLFLYNIHSFKQSVSRQVQSLFQSELSTLCDPDLPLSNESILSFP